MPLLLNIVINLLLAGRSPPTAVSEGSSSGMQMLGLGMFGIGGLLMFFAILWSAHG